MAKWTSDSALDALLDKIAEGNAISLCSQQPTTLAQANSTYKLADVTVTPGAGNGDFTKANGDTSGRKLTISEQADIPVDTTGTANHIAVYNGTELLLITTCNAQQLTSGNTVTISAFSTTVADPS